MSTGIFVALVAALGLVVLAAFVRLERTQNRMSTVLVILGLLVVESVIYPYTNAVPSGLFHPGVGADATGYDTSFRLPDLLVPLALMARMLGRGPAIRLSTASIWWLTFVAWIAAAAVMGARDGNPSDLVFFEGKVIIYIGFAFLVAGVPASEYANGKAFRRFLYGSAALALFNVALDEFKATLSISIPGVPIQGMGPMGTDTATIFLVLGLVAAATAVCSDQGRLRLLLTSVPLLFASVVVGQRAALVAMVVSLAALALFAMLKWRQIRTTPTELGLTTATFVSLLLVPALVTTVAGRREPVVPFVDSIRANLDTRQKQLSAQDRLVQWKAARERIGEHPFIGSGLGTTYQHFDLGAQTIVATDITHNIGLDLLMRTGLIGLSFFLAACLLTVRDGLRLWRNHHDRMIAALAVACTAGMLGLLAKGMVESILEKYRLAMLLGFLVGIVGSGLLSLKESAPEHTRALRPTLATRRPVWR